MSAEAIRAAKIALRLVARERRAALSPAFRAGAAQALVRVLLEESRRLRLSADQVVAGYYPIRSEIDPRAMLDAMRRQGCRIALPAAPARSGPLIFREWRLDDALAPDAMGLAAPPPTAPTLEPGLILVPLLAFDAAGSRLGYGAGFYDRTLLALRAARQILAIGVAFAAQQVPEIPAGPEDAPLDAVATETGVIWLPSPPAPEAKR